MRISKAIIFGLVALLSVTRCVEEEEDVLVLTDENFHEEIKKHEHILVEFYAPWCGHCKQLAPEYAKAAATLKKSDNPVPLAKVDATEQKKVAEEFGIQGFPTLKFFVGGKDVEYNGGRTADEIVNWITKKSGPPTKALASAEEVEKFAGDHEVVVVLLGEHEAAKKAFEQVALADDDISYGICSAEECLTKYGLAAGNVVLLKKFDEKRNDLTAEVTKESLEEFVKSNKSPTVMKFDQKCAQHVFGESVPGIFIYRDPTVEESKGLDEVFNTVAKSMKGTIQFVTTGITEQLEPRLAEYVGVKAEDLPTVRIHDTTSDLRNYVMEGDITAENITKFANDWKEGNLKAVLKSEPIPESQDEAVYVLVGNSFNDVVMDETKDVLVEFYAPWCGHCKQLAPIYEELAEKLKHNKNLIIAKMDSTTNETDKVSVSGFPTIKFFKANDKSPKDYDGERTLEGFMEYLKENVHFPITEEEKTDL